MLCAVHEPVLQRRRNNGDHVVRSVDVVGDHVSSLVIRVCSAVTDHAHRYLRHHWAIDLLAGSCYALSFFLLFRRTSLGRIDTEAIEKGSTNGWQRLVLGYGSRLPSVLPTQNSSASESYDVLSTEEIDEELAKLER